MLDANRITEIILDVEKINWLLNVCSSQLLQLDAGQNKRPDALEVIAHDRLADVIIKTAVAHLAVAGRTAETRDGTTLRQRPFAAAVVFDEIFDDAAVTFDGGGCIITRQVAVIHAFRQRIDEHRRSRG